MQYSKTLYKAHSDMSIGSWSVTVEYDPDGVVMTVTSRKKWDGKGVDTKTTYTAGKNIGKVNETTALEQAVLEAKSKVKKKIDSGYVETIKDASVKATNGLGFPKPMLAQPIDKVKQWDFPVYMQVKLDGHRMLATVKDGKAVLYSRQGKVLDVEHIREKLQSAYDNGHWMGHTLDGEVYCHGKTLQEISSLVKKPKPESTSLVYHLYDSILDWQYPDRHAEIEVIVDMIDEPCIQLVPAVEANNIDEVNAMHAEAIGAGYEGSMLRQPDFAYGEGKRCKSLMKKKDFQDDEFRVIGVDQGKRNERQNLDVAIFVCETKDGKRFSVTAPGTAEEKDQFYRNGDRYLGKALTVKFFNYTPDGIPFHPVAMRFREDV